MHFVLSQHLKTNLHFNFYEINEKTLNFTHAQLYSKFVNNIVEPNYIYAAIFNPR
jgi:hypothetical protein